MESERSTLFLSSGCCAGVGFIPPVSCRGYFYLILCCCYCALWLCNVVGCDWLLLVVMATWAPFLPNSPMCVSLPDWKGQAGIRACGRRLAGVGRWFGVLLQKHLVLVDKLKA